jgi:hypothetical protein
VDENVVKYGGMDGDGERETSRLVGVGWSDGWPVRAAGYWKTIWMLGQETRPSFLPLGLASVRMLVMAAQILTLLLQLQPFLSWSDPCPSRLSSDRAAAVRRRDQQFPGQGTKYFDEGVPNELYIRHKTKLIKVPAVRNLGVLLRPQSVGRGRVSWMGVFCDGEEGWRGRSDQSLSFRQPIRSFEVALARESFRGVSRPDIRLQM